MRKIVTTRCYVLFLELGMRMTWKNERGKFRGTSREEYREEINIREMRKTRNGGETFLIFNTTKRFKRSTKSRLDEISVERLRRIIPTNGNE